MWTIAHMEEGHVDCPVSVIQGKVFIWCIKVARHLRDARIVGSYVGHPKPTQVKRVTRSSKCTLPLLLSEEEAMLCFTLGLLDAHMHPDLSAHKDALTQRLSPSASATAAAESSLTQPQLRWVVFHDLWLRGLYIMLADPLGAHFRVYQHDPTVIHAHVMVRVVPWFSCVTGTQLSADVRLATAVKKDVALASVQPDTHAVHYMTCAWAGIGHDPVPLQGGSATTTVAPHE